ncbi:MAG: amidohydrolase family protein, partial [bacterium]
VVEGAGLYAVPSMADAAVFLSLEGRYPGVSVPSTAEASLKAEARCGMAGLLDLNAGRTFIREARAVATEPGMPLAHFAGALFAAPGGWRVSGQTPWVADVAEVQEDADLAGPWTRALRFGDQAIFASVDGGTDDLAIPLPVLEHLGSLAHARGLPFIIQTNNARRAEQALAAKPDALLGPLFGLSEAPNLPQELRTANCAYIPALGSVMNAFPPEPMAAWLRDFPEARVLAPAVRAEIEDPDNAAAWAAHWARLGADPSNLLAALHGVADAGVHLAFGTGSGLPLVFHGLGAQMEIAQWLRAGLSPTQVLRAATLGSRALIGLNGGRLEKGEPADLLLIAEDPRTDPQAMASPQRVFLGGVEVLP